MEKAVKKKLDKIDEFMKTPDFEKILNDSWNKYKGKLSKEKWEQKYKTLYKNREKGAISEKTFDDLMGFDSNQFEIQIENSKRIIDNVKNGVAREVKSGKVTWNAYKDQVMKDIHIIKKQLDENILRIEWHCFDEVDPKFIQNVKSEMKKAGLKESDFIIIKY